jgi:hypothetical protein
VPHSSRIKGEKEDLNFGKFLVGPDISGTSTEQIRSLVLFSQTNLVLLSDISGEAGQIQSKAGHVRWRFSAATLDDCFECNFLTASPIDPILLLLAS